MHKVLVTVQEDVEKFGLIAQEYPFIEMLDERKEQHRFTRGCLLISMTF